MMNNDGTVTISAEELDALIARKVSEAIKEERDKKSRISELNAAYRERSNVMCRFCDEVLGDKLDPKGMKTSYIMGAFILWCADNGVSDEIIATSTDDNKYRGAHLSLNYVVKEKFGLVVVNGKFVEQGDGDGE